mgnify:FL=1
MCNAIKKNVIKLKKLLQLLFLIIFSLIFSQNNDEEMRTCRLKFEIDTLGLSKSNIITLKITNLENRNLKISDAFSMMRIQATDIEKYNEKAKVYEKQNSYFTDVNCTHCFGKFLTLKPNKSLNYRIDLSRQYLIEKALKEPKSKYRFSLHFDTIDLLKYSAFRKCYAENFTSEKIVYKTK